MCGMGGGGPLKFGGGGRREWRRALLKVGWHTLKVGVPGSPPNVVSGCNWNRAVEDSWVPLSLNLGWRSQRAMPRRKV